MAEPSAKKAISRVNSSLLTFESNIAPHSVDGAAPIQINFISLHEITFRFA